MTFFIVVNLRYNIFINQIRKLVIQSHLDILYWRLSVLAMIIYNSTMPNFIFHF